MLNPNLVEVSFEPTEEMWDGLARKFMLALDFGCNTPRKLFEFLDTSGYSIPAVIVDSEPELKNLDHVISKGTRVCLIYKIMVQSYLNSKS